jgi:hypothetical protein
MNSLTSDILILSLGVLIAGFSLLAFLGNCRKRSETGSAKTGSASDDSSVFIASLGSTGSSSLGHHHGGESGSSSDHGGFDGGGGHGGH